MKNKIQAECSCVCHTETFKDLMKVGCNVTVCEHCFNVSQKSRQLSDWEKEFNYIAEHQGLEDSGFATITKTFIYSLLQKRDEWWMGEIESKKKIDLNLEPGFNVTAEYRLGEVRGYNQALDDILSELRQRLKEL